jgi:hypothetical protein
MRGEESAIVTEQEWMECGAPQKMLDYLADRFSTRKLLLFCVQMNCVRAKAFRTNSSLEVIERWVDGLADVFEVRAWWNMYGASVHTRPERPMEWAIEIINHEPDLDESLCYEAPAEAPTYLRDIFGNPFRSIELDPGWQ